VLLTFEEEWLLIEAALIAFDGQPADARPEV
jgi:hypothetical protein